VKKSFSILFALVLALSLCTATLGLNCGSPDDGPSLDAVAFGSTGIGIGSQVGTLTYGTPGSVTYLITVPGSGGGKTKLFTDELPSGISASFNPGSLDEPWPAYSTLTIDYDGTTAAGTYGFCVGESPSGHWPANHHVCTELTIGGTCPDADGDGVCDDDDNCPAIANPDQEDEDEDGIGDACDNCPNDPDKTDPGQCGCGQPDTDSDGDTVADCIDGCPNDPDKVNPGQCGCGQPDTDSDGDTVANCIDGCPNDPDKVNPGQCGCGVADTDSDGDGAANCIDGCPDDPLKTDPGQCGCGTPDTDSDGDSVPNCIDGCPFDPDKTEPGICGCGQPDADTDGDGQVDCVDLCPDDPDKTAPGACGCGVADTDSDGDSVPDCIDGCPDDPLKIAPGQCGCGHPDTDSDNDGTVDCLDGCPDDPEKIDPGACGCGVPDTDSNGNGIADCLEQDEPGAPSVPPCEWWYALKIYSTEGGAVTRPRWGVPYLDYLRYAYCVGEVVTLEATPDAGYHFVKWTGDVDTVADVNAAFTTIVMNGFYEITANFAR